MKTLCFPPHTLIANRCLRTILVAWLFAVALLLVVPQTARQAYAQEQFIVHVVTSGDNLSAIASRYNISLSALMSYNQISNANLIRPGQQIRIPITTVQPAPTNTPIPTSPPAPANSPAPAATEESVSPATSSPSVPAASNSTSGAPAGEASTAPTLTPVPTSTTRPAGGLIGYTAAGEPVYTVRRGDTLSGIASQYGVTVDAIMQRNSLTSYGIVASQRLIIPLRTVAPAAQPTVAPTPRPTATARPTPTSRPYNYLLITPTPTPPLR